MFAKKYAESQNVCMEACFLGKLYYFTSDKAKEGLVVD